MNRPEHFVIIGNGASANRAADVLRRGNGEIRITLISSEFFPYYYRYKLRKYLSGELGEEDLIVRPVSYYKENGIRLRLGQKVMRVDLKERIIFLKHMEKVHYDHLLFCVGGVSRIPEIYYSVRHHFSVLKTLTDARALKRALETVRSLVVVGGDLVSVRMAETFIKSGIQVTFIIHEGAFWPLEVTPDTRREFSRMLQEKGIDIFENDELETVEMLPDRGYAVITRKARRIKCDMIGAFFGFVPDVEFLIGSGLDIDRGILVDEYLKTPFDRVYAAGDCAQVYNPEIKNYWVSIGWENALQLGQVAAHNMLGSKARVEIPPINVLDCDGIKVNTSWWRDE